MQAQTQIIDASPAISYRPDIDGLRALAVVAVVAFHAFPSVVHGGYIGVDIFFVISGYLISSILLKSIVEKKFSILDFYSRRIKRIFPALVLVLAITLCIGWTIMLSDEFRRLGQNTVAATLFGSNFWLWHEAGYFDPASELKPLLHLWSLAIEEQFYVIWPPLLFFLYRITQRVTLCIVLLAIASLISCIFYINNHVSMFYFPQNRAWELLIGAFLASLKLKNLPDSQYSNHTRFVSRWNLFSCASMFLILCCVFTLDKKSIFPGWLALFPTLCTAIIIFAGERAWINRHILSSRVVVSIGLISYPLYLWHWPLLAFSRIMENGEPSAAIRGICVVISVVLSWLTYRFLEIPLRHGGKRVVTALIMATVIIGMLGYFCGNATIKSRAAFYQLENIMNAFDDFGWPKKNYVPFRYGDLVLDSRGENKAATIFIGDSNMQQYLPRIDKIISEDPEAYNRVIFAAFGACLPVTHIKAPADPDNPCPALMDSVYRLALTDPDINTVVIAASWVTYFGTSGFELHYDDHGKLYPLSGADGEKKALNELESTILKLKHAGKNVFLILNIPQGDEFDPRGLINRSWKTLGFGLVKPYEGVPRKIVESRQVAAVFAIRDIAKRTGITVFDPVDIICNRDTCPVLTDEGLPIYKDYNHLNARFAKEHMTFLDQTVIKR